MKLKLISKSLSNLFFQISLFILENVGLINIFHHLIYSMITSPIKLFHFLTNSINTFVAIKFIIIIINLFNLVLLQLFFLPRDLSLHFLNHQCLKPRISRVQELVNNLFLNFPLNLYLLLLKHYDLSLLQLKLTQLLHLSHLKVHFNYYFVVYGFDYCFDHSL